MHYVGKKVEFRSIFLFAIQVSLRRFGTKFENMWIMQNKFGQFGDISNMTPKQNITRTSVSKNRFQFREKCWLNHVESPPLPQQ